jgi:hypothetical protein
MAQPQREGSALCGSGLSRPSRDVGETTLLPLGNTPAIVEKRQTQVLGGLALYPMAA